jgi:hypothetical protein
VRTVIGASLLAGTMVLSGQVPVGADDTRDTRDTRPAPQ